MTNAYLAAVIHGKCGKDVRDCCCKDGVGDLQPGAREMTQQELRSTLDQVLRRLERLEQLHREDVSGLVP